MYRAHKLAGLVTAAFFAVFGGTVFSADPGNPQNRAHVVWEIDAVDVGKLSGDRPVRVFMEYLQKQVTVTNVALDTGEIITKSHDIWWIFRDGSLYFTSDGRNDIPILFLDDNTMRQGEGREIILLKRSSNLKIAAAGNAARANKAATEAEAERRQRLHNAVRAGNIDEIQRLVRQGSDVNALDQDGMAPMHLAAAAGNIDIMLCLERIR